MKQVEITIWEQENKGNIVGWEIEYGYYDEQKNWISYATYDVITFNMKDKTQVKFEREK